MLTYVYKYTPYLRLVLSHLKENRHSFIKVFIGKSLQLEKTDTAISPRQGPAHLRRAFWNETPEIHTYVKLYLKTTLELKINILRLYRDFISVQ
jgi:hypothetical protein